MMTLVVGGCLAMLMAVAKSSKEKGHGLSSRAYLAVSLLTLAVAFVFLMALEPSHAAAWHGTLVIDRLSIVSQGLLLAIMAVSMCVGSAYLTEYRIVRGEYFALMLFCGSGMLLMVQATELLTFFIGLEIMSLAIYVLVGFRRADRQSQEAAVKYFISGAFASAFFLFGSGLLFGATGSTDYNALSSVVRGAQPLPTMFLIGATLCLIAFAFKVAAVPFHMWAPDAYQGAPTMVTGFMAVGVKAAALIAFTRFVLMALGDGVRGQLPLLIPLLQGLAIATMTVGNLTAVLQKNLKRMLAYSSIAQAPAICSWASSVRSKPVARASPRFSSICSPMRWRLWVPSVCWWRSNAARRRTIKNCSVVTRA